MVIAPRAWISRMLDNSSACRIVEFFGDGITTDASNASPGEPACTWFLDGAHPQPLQHIQQAQQART
jgi:hypothetical protein